MLCWWLDILLIIVITEWPFNPLLYVFKVFVFKKKYSIHHENGDISDYTSYPKQAYNDKKNLALLPCLDKKSIDALNCQLLKVI